MTDLSGERPHAWVFYDANCSLCSRWIQRLEPLLRAAGFSVAPLQTLWVRERLGLAEGTPIEMRVLLPDGRAPGGSEAILEIAQRLPWGWPLVWISVLPGAKPLLRLAYRKLAQNRYCLTAARGARLSKILGWLPLVPLICLALASARGPAWIFMWILAACIFFGFKWVTLRHAPSGGARASRARVAAYLFGWPGMDARSFLDDSRGPSVQGMSTAQWIWPLVKISFGLLLLFIAVRLTFLKSLLRGWLGMVAIILFLHFGVFDLLALAWRKRGIAVTPVMRQPLRATSLADFWGNRWNTAFNQLAHELCFRPLVRQIGPEAATVSAFLFSGLVHEVVISIPARAGYGWPTLYFLLQGFGLLFERGSIGHTLGLSKGWLGRAFTLGFTAIPAFWLFHPPFIHNVIVPMLEAINTILKRL